MSFRYIEVFRSSTKEMQKRSHPPSLMNTRPGPYDRPDFGGGRMGRYSSRGGNIKGNCQLLSVLVVYTSHL
jgi:hypothetical protein